MLATATKSPPDGPAAYPMTIAGVFHAEITGEDQERNQPAALVARVLDELRSKAGLEPPEDESDVRLMYFHAAASRLQENAVRRLHDSKASIRQAREEGREDVEALSRDHAVRHALDLMSQQMFFMLARDPELAADVQSVYAGTLSRIRNEGITVENLNPVQVQRIMNGLAAAGRIQDLDQRACGAGQAALEVARLASLSLRTTAAKLCGNPDWGRNIGNNPAERSETLLKFTAECYGLAAASIYVINLLSAV